MVVQSGHMSGHSKWSTIKRQKSANDAKRGAVFTKLGNAITIAVREGGGGDPGANFRLRLAMDKAREVNMPKENIQRAIDRALGKGESAALENVLYESFGPKGTAILIEAVTDNKNRTSGEIRKVLEQGGGNLGSSGSVSYLFAQQGEIRIAKPGGSLTLDNVLDQAIEAGAEDVSEDQENFLIYTGIADLHKVKVALETSGLPVTSAELVYRPNSQTMVNIDDVVQAQKILDLVANLEDLDDVQNVYVNLS